MSPEQKIIEYLKTTYHPAAILLHGSRAIGKNREHSDWDIIMLFDADAKIPRRGNREEVAGEDVEWKSYQLPVADGKIVEVFDVYLQFAKVLWEKDSIGTDLLARARAEYIKGPNLSVADIKRERQFFLHKIMGMKDDTKEPYLFLRHLSVVFNRASNMWFEVSHNQFAKPFYLALPLIQEQDPEYYEHLMILCSSEHSDIEKIVSADWIARKLFEEKV